MNGPVDTSTNMVTLYDFTAKWCGPCRTMKPVLDALAKEYAGRVQVVEVDVDEDQLTTQQFDVRAMPTYVLVRDGREVGRFVGSRPRAFVAGGLGRAISGDGQITAPLAGLSLLQRSSCLRARCSKTATCPGVTPSAAAASSPLSSSSTRSVTTCRCTSPSLAMQPSSCAAVTACSSAWSGAGTSLTRAASSMSPCGFAL